MVRHNQKNRCAISIIVLMTVMFSVVSALFPLKANAANIVICIDPGHGGDNLGAQYYGKMEKDQTLVIGMALYEELSKYEGITVVMTRTDDVALSLAERAEIAEKAGAEFLVSLHLNASETHTFHGAEVWSSGFGSFYSKGNMMGNIVLDELNNQCGLFSRKGVKCKLSSSGEEDYYGVINNSRKRDVTGIIIEHCHMDVSEDYIYWCNDDALKRLGIADATAIAKYYGLHSDILGVDYSDYAPVAVPMPDEPMGLDITAPDRCNITLLSYEDNVAYFELDAVDGDSGICYYSVSKNGGYSWSRLYKWEDDGTGIIAVYLPEGKSFNVVVKAWNYYQDSTESNVCSIN